MLEHRRREHHLLSGMAVQLVVIGLLVFAYTQAARNLNYQRGLYLQLKEQLANARQEVRSKGEPDLAGLEARVADVQSSLPKVDALPDWAKTVEGIARERFQLRESAVRVGSLEKVVIHLVEKTSVEIPLYVVELKGEATSQQVAGLVGTLNQPALKIVSPLDEIELQALAPGQPVSLETRLRWLVATGPTTHWKAPDVSLLPAIPLNWGARQEPFLPLTKVSSRSDS